eukprot:12225078-Prorocentrum_lima.AAC.1
MSEDEAKQRDREDAAKKARLKKSGLTELIADIPAIKKLGPCLPPATNEAMVAARADKAAPT